MATLVLASRRFAADRAEKFWFWPSTMTAVGFSMAEPAHGVFVEWCQSIPRIAAQRDGAPATRCQLTVCGPVISLSEDSPSMDYLPPRGEVKIGFNQRGRPTAAVNNVDGGGSGAPGPGLQQVGPGVEALTVDQKLAGSTRRRTEAPTPASG